MNYIFKDRNNLPFFTFETVRSHFFYVTNIYYKKKRFIPLK